MVVKTFAQPDEINVINRNGYQLLAREIIGIGFFGRIFAARPIPSKFQSSDKMKFLKTPKQMVTIKVIYLDVGFEQIRNLNRVIEKEIVTMNRCFGNPNILGLLDVFFGAKRVFFVFEFAEKENLTVQLSKPRKTYMKEQEILTYIRGACLGLKILHSLGVAHGDLNPDSIFITKTNRAKLGEFSFVKFTEKACLFLDDKESDKNQQKESNIFSGAINYAAPEVLDPKVHDYDPQAADIWSLGATLYLMLNGRLPFQGQNKEEILTWQKKYFNNEARLVFVKNTTAACRELVWSMLSQDPKKRPTAWDLLESKCLKRHKTKEEYVQMGNLAANRLLKIFEDKMYDKQQKSVTEYLTSRQLLLEEVYSSRKSDDDYHKFVAIPFNEGGKKTEEIWRMTMSRNTFLYGMTAISNSDPSKIKVFRNLSGLKVWKEMKSNKDFDHLQAPEPSSRHYSSSADETKCFFCEDDSQCLTSSVGESTQQDSTLDKKFAPKNWICIDFDKIFRSNKSRMRPYECNSLSSDLISKKPTTSGLSSRKSASIKLDEKRAPATAKSSNLKAQKFQKDGGISQKYQKVKRVQTSKEKKLKAKALTETKAIKVVKEKTWNDNTKQYSSSKKHAKDGKAIQGRKAKRNENKTTSKSNSREKNSTKIEAKEIEELTPSCNSDIDAILSPRDTFTFSKLSLTPRDHELTDDEDLPVLRLADNDPDQKLAIFKEKFKLFGQQSKKKIPFTERKRAASACCTRTSIASGKVKEYREKGDLADINEEDDGFKINYLTRAKSVAQ